MTDMQIDIQPVPPDAPDPLTEPEKVPDDVDLDRDDEDEEGTPSP